MVTCGWGNPRSLVDMAISRVPNLCPLGCGDTAEFPAKVLLLLSPRRFTVLSVCTAEIQLAPFACPAHAAVDFFFPEGVLNHSYFA